MITVRNLESPRRMATKFWDNTHMDQHVTVEGPCTWSTSGAYLRCPEHSTGCFQVPLMKSF